MHFASLKYRTGEMSPYLLVLERLPGEIDKMLMTIQRRESPPALRHILPLSAVKAYRVAGYRDGTVGLNYDDAVDRVVIELDLEGDRGQLLVDRQSFTRCINAL